MATTPKNPGTGAPQWTYAVAAIVAVLTLIWGVVSTIWLKPPDPVKPATAPSAPNVAAASGGATVNINVNVPSSTAPASSPALANKATATDPSASVGAVSGGTPAIKATSVGRAAAAPHVTAYGGGVAVGGDMIGSTVTTGGAKPDTPPLHSTETSK